MKVRYLVAASGDRNVNFAPGDVREVSPELARRLIERGIAEPVADRDRQTTTSRKAASAEKRGARARRRTAEPVADSCS